jgi:RNA polymerase sigma factor (sigma-70 family)
MTQLLMVHSETDKPPAGQRDDNWSKLLILVGKNRDQAAFGQLFAHFAPLIKGFCLANPAQSLPGEAADELVQEVLFKVWTKAPYFDASKSAASTWIFTVMRNTRIDMMRRNSRHLVSSVDVEVDDIWDEELDHQPLVRLQQSRNADLIHASFAELPQEQKQALTQVYMQGKSHSEIAEETGLPLGTVKSRVRMGLKKLQATLGKREQIVRGNP